MSLRVSHFKFAAERLGLNILWAAGCVELAWALSYAVMEITECGHIPYRIEQVSANSIGWVAIQIH